MQTQPTKAGRGQVFMVFGLLLLPVLAALFVVFSGMKDKEITPKWEKRSPDSTTNISSGEIEGTP